MKVGIYGGTFAPFHNGHARSAKAFIEALSLDRLIIIPTFMPPHKEVKWVDNPSDRYNMLQLFLSDFIYKDITEISDFEIRQSGKSYSYLTLQYFRQKYDDIFFLVGDDMFLTLGDWVKPEIIFSLCTVVCFQRSGDDEIKDKIEAKKSEYILKYGAKIECPCFTPYDISSTRIRMIARYGGDISEFVPPMIAKYISDNGLYSFDKTLEYLRKEVSLCVDEKRFAHILSTEKTAHEMALMFGMDNEHICKLRVAAILHDVTKCKCEKEQRALYEQLKLEPNDDFSNLGVLHSHTGAAYSKNKYPDIVDDEIYNMIYVHTTGKKNMTLSEKILYLADFIEPNRENEACKRLRAYYFENLSSYNCTNLEKHLDKTLLLSYDMTIKFLIEKGEYIAEQTLCARNFIIKEMKFHEKNNS